VGRSTRKQRYQQFTEGGAGTKVFTPPTDDELDNRDPNQPLRDAGQDIYNTDLLIAQETCPAVDHAGYTAPTRQHELRLCRSAVYLPCLADLDHELYWEHQVICPRCESVPSHGQGRGIS